MRREDVYICGNPHDKKQGKFCIFAKVIYRNDKEVRLKRFQEYGAYRIGDAVLSIEDFTSFYRRAEQSDLLTLEHVLI